MWYDCLRSQSRKLWSWESNQGFLLLFPLYTIKKRKRINKTISTYQCQLKDLVKDLWNSATYNIMVKSMGWYLTLSPCQLFHLTLANYLIFLSFSFLIHKSGKWQYISHLNHTIKWWSASQRHSDCLINIRYYFMFTSGKPSFLRTLFVV